MTALRVTILRNLDSWGAGADPCSATEWLPIFACFAKLAGTGLGLMFVGHIRGFGGGFDNFTYCEV
jgi:hypothetical protein